MSDLNDILSWPHPSRLYEFDEIPMERDLVMVGAGQLEDLRREWARYLSELGQGEPRSPDEKIDGRWCAIEGRTKDSFDLNVCITVTTRYHGAVKKLPRSTFVLCIDFWNHAKSPYLVVDQSWFDEIGRETFSLYALVDAVGMRSLLDRQGRITAGHPPRQLYVSATVFWSLRFGPLDAKDRLSESLVPFASELTTPDGRSYRRRRDRVTA